MKREFLMLGHNYTGKENINGWFMSEKLDGVRCYYDGGITRGLKASWVPWANTAKDGRYKNEVICTGLWTRYGKVIQAPPSFLDKLPAIPLDGELWMGRGRFQDTISTVKQLIPDHRWSLIQFKVFDCPTYMQVFTDGSINNVNFKKDFKGILRWIEQRRVNAEWISQYRTFAESIAVLHELGIEFVPQIKVGDLESYMNEVLALGGEGLMLRNPNSIWQPHRSHHLLKYKPTLVGEGKIIGFTDGKGKLEGLVGALVIEWSGGSFFLSGMTDAERIKDRFSIGEIVKFSYRELTDGGTPKEARFLRG